MLFCVCVRARACAGVAAELHSVSVVCFVGASMCVCVFGVSVRMYEHVRGSM